MLSEQEEFNRGRMLRKERKVYPLFVGHCTQRMQSSRFYLVYLLCPWRYHFFSIPLFLNSSKERGLLIEKNQSYHPSTYLMSQPSNCIT